MWHAGIVEDTTHLRLAPVFFAGVAKIASGWTTVDIAALLPVRNRRGDLASASLLSPLKSMVPKERRREGAGGSARSALACRTSTLDSKPSRTPAPHLDSEGVSWQPTLPGRYPHRTRGWRNRNRTTGAYEQRKQIRNKESYAGDVGRVTWVPSLSAVAAFPAGGLRERTEVQAPRLRKSQRHKYAYLEVRGGMISSSETS